MQQQVNLNYSTNFHKSMMTLDFIYLFSGVKRATTRAGQTKAAMSSREKERGVSAGGAPGSCVACLSCRPVTRGTTHDGRRRTASRITASHFPTLSGIGSKTETAGGSGRCKKKELTSVLTKGVASAVLRLSKAEE